jgi:hypothetical protein
MLQPGEVGTGKNKDDAYGGGFVALLVRTLDLDLSFNFVFSGRILSPSV